MNIELKENQTLIIKKYPGFGYLPFKVLIKELTKTTIVYQNLDAPNAIPHRIMIKDFQEDYQILEEVEYNAIKDFTSTGNLVIGEYGR